MRALILTLLLAACLAPPTIATESISVSPSLDNTLFEDETGALSNGAGPHFVVGTSGDLAVRRGLLAFDVASVIPGGSIIEEVELQLHLSAAPDPPDTRMITIHRLVRPWGEGTSVSNDGTGAPSTAGDATWLHAIYPGSFWTTPGGDFEETAIAYGQVQGVGDYVWSDPTMAADVQSWLDQPVLAWGWLLQNEEDDPTTARRFDSREHPIAANRPVLVVRFTPPTATETATWGRLKSLHCR